jgi:hypothetical protein
MKSASRVATNRALALARTSPSMVDLIEGT